MKSQVHAVFLVDGADQLRKIIGIDIIHKVQGSLTYLNSVGVQLELLSFHDFASQVDYQQYSAVIALAAWEGFTDVLKFGKSISIPIVAYSTSDLLMQKPGELSFEADSVCIAPHADQDLAIAVLLATSRVSERQRFQQQIESLEQQIERTTIVEKAKVILADRMNLSEQNAYKTLRQYARSNRTELYEIARTVVDGHRIIDTLIRKKEADSSE